MSERLEPTTTETESSESTETTTSLVKQKNIRNIS